MTALEFRPMLAGDAVLLELQPSQHFELGVEHFRHTLAEGEELADCAVAWTACRGTRIVAIAGIRELFLGHGLAWASLGAGLGADHLAITRFARRILAEAPFRRVETVVEAANLKARSWASLVGFRFGRVLAGFGPAERDHLLYERLNP